MSEMGSEEFPETPADRLNDAIIAFTGCIGEALNADGKEGVCSYGWTIGDTYVPFDPDEDNDSCTEEEAVCSQMWVRVTNLTPLPVAVENWDTTTCALQMSMGLEVGILRCVEIPEGGEAPTESNVLADAMQSMDDMNTILCAALGCEGVEDKFDKITVGQWVPTGPDGGQYGGIWTFTAEL